MLFVQRKKEWLCVCAGVRAQEKEIYMFVDVIIPILYLLLVIMMQIVGMSR